MGTVQVNETGVIFAYEIHIQLSHLLLDLTKASYVRTLKTSEFNISAFNP